MKMRPRETLMENKKMKPCSFATCWRFKITWSAGEALICSVFLLLLLVLARRALVYITFPPWHSTIFVCRRRDLRYGRKVTKYTENSQTCTDGLFQGLKLLVTHLIQYCMGVQKSTESLSFDLRSISCRMRRPTHSKVYPAVSQIKTSQNT